MEHQLVWLDLATDDLAVRDFYAELFNWEVSGDENSYFVSATSSEKLSVSINKNPGQGHIPSHWTPFISVDDVNEWKVKAKALGAEVVHDTHETPHGIVATLLDPAGAPFFLFGNK